MGYTDGERARRQRVRQLRSKDKDGAGPPRGAVRGDGVVPVALGDAGAANGRTTVGMGRQRLRRGGLGAGERDEQQHEPNDGSG